MKRRSAEYLAHLRARLAERKREQLSLFSE